MRLMIILIVGIFNTNYSYASPIRTIEVSENQIITLNTKLGFSTKIIFETKPKPGLVGDQDAFSVEYLGKVVSIKPLIPGSQTNLFIPSREGNYNFILRATNKNPDNVVYIKRKKAKDLIEQSKPYPNLSSKNLYLSDRCKSMHLSLNRLMWPESRSSWIFDFEIKITRNKKTISNIKANGQYNFVLWQDGVVIPIEGVFQDRFFREGNHYVAKGKIHVRQEKLSIHKKFQLTYGPKDKKEKDQKCLPLKIKLPSIKKTLNQRR